MRILIDTHVAIWAVIGDPKLPAHAVSAIEQASDIYVSAASIWEISIKFAAKKGGINFSGAQALEEFRLAGFKMLSVHPRHAAAVDELPLLHGDPFDRILVAQARTEPMHFLTCDAALKVYEHLVSLL